MGRHLGSASAGAVDAAVVGAGPNGLAAAITLAGAGLKVAVYEAADTVGGGTRTAQVTLPGFRHDICASVHPMGLASPFFRAFDLAAHGVEMLRPEVAYAHPLDGGGGGLAWQDLGRTAESLGPDGRAWQALFAPLVDRWQQMADLAMSDLRHLPAHPAVAARLALGVLEQGSPLRSLRFRGSAARALLAGVSAHGIAPPGSPVATAVGVVLGTLAHAVGWPVPRGGTQRIADALAAELRDRGGEIVTGHRVRSLDDLPRARAVLLDVAPSGLAAIAGDALPSGYARALRTSPMGPAVCKVDFALSGPVPWTTADCERAGTLHLVGTHEEAVAAEREVRRGRHPERPYVLVVQPGVVDASRAPEGQCTLYSYAHVPHGSTLDLGDAVTAQIERFAPGFRDLVLARRVTPAVALEDHNPNYVGGSIMGGDLSLWRTAMRPVVRWDPYTTPLEGLYLCSASTPPGPAVHGMCGVHAAGRALRRRFGIRTDPLDLVRAPHGRGATAEPHGAGAG
ncbi:phytoene desaturase family protein [Kitasatospora sp. DSM 101779]|uniref:phytoene desaturase family protein n=1 Tax=Kitasatospora sp. DSM 101779 TaxID=2853165 RepID=UPI0021D969A5|nr:NAD(P)/FAD-dependent oxidoreductase [Kitasatospora sp. DSM 101779]MCU7820143.1 NAD(P)/FAD-dependent oxidoreductase [Kitasatospora sp. DSM 101779]